jgi:putative peptidoglycan lipid II flippase
MKAPGVFTVLHRKIRGLHEAAYLLAFFTFGSQLFALARDRLLAHTFGAGETLDLFYAAFRIPDTLYAVLASMVSLFVLIPFLESAERESEGATRDFLSNMFTFFTGALALVAGLCAFFAPYLLVHMYPGFSAEAQESLVGMVRILLFQPILLGVSNLCAAYVQVRGRFVLYAVAPILYNLGIIVGILVLYPMVGTYGLAWGVVLGAVLHLSIQLPFLVEKGMTPRLVWPRWRQVRQVVAVSIPRTITLSAQQFVMLALVSLASFYGVGSIAGFTLAFNLQAVPLALIGASYSVAAFPRLARLYSKGEKEEYLDVVRTATRQIIFWALPALVLVIVLRAHIVRVILGSGAFDWDATMQTSALLALLVVSLVAQGLIVLLVRACYAAGRTWAPLVLNVGSSLATVGLAFLLLHLADIGTINLASFSSLMRVSGVEGSEVLLIAVAYSGGAFINMALLLMYFERKADSFVRSLIRTTWQSLVSSLVGGVGAYLALQTLSVMVSLHTGFGIFIQGAGAGVIGLVLWGLVLAVLESEDAYDAWAGIHKKITATRLRRARGSIEGV